uniref:Crossover junction endodeoxyribonuclease RuvC n=1 Tax=uncultured myxobacterium HF0200_01L06 TaxID=723556 RepID=E7C3H3_9BACT|nr:holliday junction resolvasome, endonuclease subunit [uncultured myxobacterium HF0200_01L06]
MRIIGIDPGSVATGWGLVEIVEGRMRHVAHGTVRPPRGGSLASRLAFLHRGLLDVIERNEPDRAVVERVFVSRNPRSALVLGHARGTALAALGGFSIGVEELSAREIKQAVVGTGSASKSQVQGMVKKLLDLEAKPASDAADALAAAIGGAHRGRLPALGVVARTRRRTRRRAGWRAGGSA